MYLRTILNFILTGLLLVGCGRTKKFDTPISNRNVSYMDSILPYIDLTIDNFRDTTIVLNKSVKVVLKSNTFYDSLSRIYPERVHLKLYFTSNPFLLALMSGIIDTTHDASQFASKNLQFYFQVVKDDKFKVQRQPQLLVYPKGNAYKVAYSSSLNKTLKIATRSPENLDSLIEIPDMVLPEDLASKGTPEDIQTSTRNLTIEQNLFFNMQLAVIGFTDITPISSSTRELFVTVASSRIDIAHLNVIAFLKDADRNYYHVLKFDTANNQFIFDKKYTNKCAVYGNKIEVVCYGHDQTGWVWISTQMTITKDERISLSPKPRSVKQIVNYCKDLQ